MPVGRTHDIISILFLPILIIILYFIGFSILSIVIISISYIFSSFMFNGDLDVPSEPFYRWGYLRWIWIPYHRIPHRSILSHGLIIGTLFRLIYLFLIPFIVLCFYGFDFSIFYKVETLYVLLGLECGSALHTISDKIF